MGEQAGAFSQLRPKPLFSRIPPPNLTKKNDPANSNDLECNLLSFLAASSIKKGNIKNKHEVQRTVSKFMCFWNNIKRAIVCLGGEVEEGKGVEGHSFE